MCDQILKLSQVYTVCVHLNTTWCNVRYIAAGLSQPSVGQVYGMCVHLYTIGCNVIYIDVDLSQPSVDQVYGMCVHLYTIECNVIYIAVDLSQPSVGNRYYVEATAQKQRQVMCSTGKLGLASFQTVMYTYVYNCFIANLNRSGLYCLGRR